jgi:hypothetical protein
MEFKSHFHFNLGNLTQPVLWKKILESICACQIALVMQAILPLSCLAQGWPWDMAASHSNFGWQLSLGLCESRRQLQKQRSLAPHLIIQHDNAKKSIYTYIYIHVYIYMHKYNEIMMESSFLWNKRIFVTKLSDF